MASINNAHLIHDHSSGRSSTRLHAPPGGHSSMGSSFGWGAEEPAAPVRGRATSVYVSPIKMAAAPQAYSSPQQQPQHFQQSSAAIGSPYGETQGNSGFGDTGHSSIRLHAPSGGNNSMGSSFGWDEGAQAPRSSPPSRMQVSFCSHLSSCFAFGLILQILPLRSNATHF